MPAAMKISASVIASAVMCRVTSQACSPWEWPSGRAVTAVSDPPSAAVASRHGRLWAVVRAAAIVAITVGSALAVYAERATIASRVASLRRSGPGWVMAGFAAECASMAAFALLQQRLLRAAGTRLTFGTLLAVAYTSNAITLAVPVAGSGMAAAYSQRSSAPAAPIPATVSLALLVERCL